MKLAPLILSILLTSCAATASHPNYATDNVTKSKKSMTPEHAKFVLTETGKNFAFGNGLGEAAVFIGSIFVFPVYAIYRGTVSVANAFGAGIPPAYSLLPEPGQEVAKTSWDTITGAPGWVVAKTVGEEFRDKDIVAESEQNIVKIASN